MKRLAQSTLALAALLCAAGCGEQWGGITRPRAPAPYAQPTSPAAVIHDLEMTFARGDVQEFDALLGVDFVVRFPRDTVTGARDSLIRAEIYNFFEHLVITGSTDGTTRPAATITLAVDTLATTPDTLPGQEGRVRVDAVIHFRLTRADGSHLTLDGPAVLYFAPQPTGSGRWVLAAWDDTGGTFTTLMRQYK